MCEIIIHMTYDIARMLSAVKYQSFLSFFPFRSRSRPYCVFVY